MLDPSWSIRPRSDDDDPDDDDEDEKEPLEKGPRDYLARGLLKHRVVMVTKAVDRDLMAAIVAQLLILDGEDPEAPITVYVNCPGGDADSGFGIYDAMRYVRAPITTVCMGLAASAAIIIFLGGRKGRRFTLPHSRFLIHQPSSMARGAASDLEITANEIVKTRDKYVKIVSDETGRPEKKILSDINRDYWLDADQALEYGLADKVIREYSEIH